MITPRHTIIASAALLAACASQTPAENVVYAGPDWFLTPHQSDAALYATGMAESADLQFAIDKAMLEARANLAERVKGKTSIISKSHKFDSGALLSQSAERTQRTVAANADLAGCEVTKEAVVTAGALYRAYVMVRYVPSDGVSTAGKAYKELDHREAAPQSSPQNEPPLPQAAPRPPVNEEQL